MTRPDATGTAHERVVPTGRAHMPTGRGGARAARLRRLALAAAGRVVPAGSGPAVAPAGRVVPMGTGPAPTDRGGARAARLRRLALAAAGVAFPLIASACSSGVTPAPLQASLSGTFAHLYVLQQVEQGNPRPSLRSLATRASCQKGTPSTAQSGAGNNWFCEVIFLVAGPSTPVTARYNVDVETDGCYAADGDGPVSVNGSRTITGPDYQQVVNPLWLIDGCFDVT